MTRNTTRYPPVLIRQCPANLPRSSLAPLTVGQSPSRSTIANTRAMIGLGSDAKPFAAHGVYPTFAMQGIVAGLTFNRNPLTQRVCEPILPRPRCCYSTSQRERRTDPRRTPAPTAYAKPQSFAERSGRLTRNKGLPMSPLAISQSAQDQESCLRPAIYSIYFYAVRFSMD